MQPLRMLSDGTIIRPAPHGLWSVPRERAGETVYILGGGPSIKGYNIDALKGRRVIAVNEAGLSVAPWADVLFWADQRWLDWNIDRLHLHTGAYKVTRKRPHLYTPHEINVVKFLPSDPWPRNPWEVGGHCGGSSAIHLACHFGAKKIVLLGFDVRAGNFHNHHQKPSLPRQHEDKFIPMLNRMAPVLESRGIKVFNACWNSALKCFQKIRKADILNV